MLKMAVDVNNMHSACILLKRMHCTNHHVQYEDSSSQGETVTMVLNINKIQPFAKNIVHFTLNIVATISIGPTKRFLFMCIQHSVFSFKTRTTQQKNLFFIE